MKKIILFAILFYTCSLFSQPESVQLRMIREGKIKELEMIEYVYKDDLDIEHNTTRKEVKIFDRDGKMLRTQSYICKENKIIMLSREENYSYNQDGKLDGIIIAANNKEIIKSLKIYSYEDNKIIEKEYQYKDSLQITTSTNNLLQALSNTTVTYKDEKDRDTLTLYYDKNDELKKKVRQIYDDIGLKEKITEDGHIVRELRENDNPYEYNISCFRDGKLEFKKIYLYDNYGLVNYSLRNEENEEIFWMMPIILTGDNLVIEEEYHNEEEGEIYRRRYEYTFYEDEE